MTRWSAKVEHKQKLSKEDAKFIFEQAEKMLKDSVESNALIISRTNTLIPILSTLVIAITGYIINQLGKTDMQNFLITAAVTDLYFLVLTILAVTNVLPHPYSAVGSLPINLFDDRFFINAIPNDDRIMRYHISESEDYQTRIEANNKTSSRRWKTYKGTLWALALSPIFIAFIYLILVAFTFPPSC